MSSPAARTPTSGLTRRTAMAGAVASAGVLMGGCTTDRRHKRADRRPKPQAAQQDPDVALAEVALAGERAVVDAVTATIDSHTDLAVMLAPVLEAHRSHVRLLHDAAPSKPPPSPTTPGVSPGLHPFRVPARPRAALRRLSALEDELSVTNRRHAFAAESGAFARVLASMAASASQHTRVLRQAAENGAS